MPTDLENSLILFSPEITFRVFTLFDDFAKRENNL